ncbi:hypothetical protein G6F68_017432 [Rhizopus microsporus]|nr:hypothetical protein G6F68_017432 [Rhizopus microsporus]
MSRSVRRPARGPASPSAWPAPRTTTAETAGSADRWPAAGAGGAAPRPAAVPVRRCGAARAAHRRGRAAGAADGDGPLPAGRTHPRTGRSCPPAGLHVAAARLPGQPGGH